MALRHGRYEKKMRGGCQRLQCGRAEGLKMSAGRKE